MARPPFSLRSSNASLSGRHAIVLCGAQGWGIKLAQEGSEMAQLMRKCAQCGTLDNGKSWSSPDKAAQDGAFDDRWTCSSCAWTEFDMVDSEAEAADRTETAGVA
jgi:ribosomal protein S27AE